MAGLLFLVRRDQAAIGSNDPPPRQSIAPGEDSADGARCARVPGFLGDLTVRSHFAGAKSFDRLYNFIFERRS
jgi:hypothetical protein